MKCFVLDGFCGFVFGYFIGICDNVGGDGFEFWFDCDFVYDRN